MGLDMYLEAELYVGGKFEHREVHGTVDFNMRGKNYDIPLNTLNSITVDVGYWRKANAIHAWFVDNVQGGVDECQRSYVTAEQLRELYGVCEQAIADHSKAGELLPTREGFFFGATAIDEYYFDEVYETKKIVLEALKKIEEGWEIYYQSSW